MPGAPDAWDGPPRSATTGQSYGMDELTSLRYRTARTGALILGR